MFCLALHACGFRPAEDLLDPVALDPAPRVARTARVAGVYGAGSVSGTARWARSDRGVAHAVHETARVLGGKPTLQRNPAERRRLPGILAASGISSANCTPGGVETVMPNSVQISAAYRGCCP